MMNDRKRPFPFALVTVILVAVIGLILAFGYRQWFPREKEVKDKLAGLSHTEITMRLLSEEEDVYDSALKKIDKNWDDGYQLMLIEILPFVLPEVSTRIVNLLKEKTGLDFGKDDKRWYQSVWQKPYAAPDDYAQFKSKLYSQFADLRFAEYFDPRYQASIRLDEIQHGGVKRDGIPPLKNPEVIPAADAAYLDDSNIVFGVVVNGEARAYPKRVLAWHEMVKDKLGGESITGVYCTLCGSMIVYKSGFRGKHYELGTSGFLYRSNKLMYDHKTKSLWSTLIGEPVVGPLVDKGIRLQPHYVVTTTWGKWKSLHPDTTVLSLNTGHKRNYDEGEAYKGYFATDDLMFDVSLKDSRLKNKERVLALRFGPAGKESQLAITIEFLKLHQVYGGALADVEFVVLTDSTGAARVYDRGDVNFVKWDETSTVTDSDGNVWKVTPEHLKSPAGETLERLPAHEAFWFGWYAAFPNTKLIE